MKIVWKYELRFDDEQQISMPEGAEILYFGNQSGTPCVWARVDSNADKSLRQVSIRGTGHPNADGRYIGSALFDEGALVFHCFENM